MNTDIASLEWLDIFKFRLERTESLKTCLSASVSWLSSWIDLEFRSDSPLIDVVLDYSGYCKEMAAEIETCQSEDDEFWIWSWGMAAEMFDLCDKSGLWTEQEMIEYLRNEINDVELSHRPNYARHLFLAAVAFIHGWTGHQAGFRS
jgi:hypothetical protein